MAGMNPRNISQEGSAAVGRNGSGWGLLGMGGQGEGGTWHPTVTYLVVLVILEFLAFAAMRYTFRKVHGG